MTSEYIPTSLRRIVQARSKGYCEYCYSPEAYATEGFVVEHVYPRVAGGLSTLDNLAWSCIGCNSHKHAKTTAIDPQTQQSVALFNPRTQLWQDHFRWDDYPTQIIGTTPCGRATVEALYLNRQGVVNLRSLLVLAKKHPPYPK
jgi:hypothetical protein